MNTCTVFMHFCTNMSANITLPPQEQFWSEQYRHVDMSITTDVLKKGNRGSFHLWVWVKDDHDLAVISVPKARLVVSLPLEEQI
jgi:hypothetical protein